MESLDQINYFEAEQTPKKKDSWHSGPEKVKISNNIFWVSNPSPSSYFSLPEVFLKEKRDREFLRLLKILKEKLNEHPGYFEEIDHFFVFKNTAQLIDQILQLNPKYLTLETTNDSSVFIQSRFNENILYLELFFDDDIPEGYELVTIIYRNGENILAYGGDLNTAIFKIKEKLDLNEPDVESTLKKPYGISETPSSETAL